MRLEPQQISELLHIIDKNQLVVMLKELGPDFLTTQDKEKLAYSGVDINKDYELNEDTIFTSFHFGLLSEAIGQTAAAKLSYEQLKGYIKHGDYIPLTIREQGVLNSVKAQLFNDLKTLNGKIFQDVNQVLVNQGFKGTLADQKKFLENEVKAGLTNKWNVRMIANEIGHKTGDWSRDFDRIITYTSTLAFEHGKAEMIQRNAGDEDPIVYKTVFSGACKHCIRLFLTAGVGSQPRLFRLSQLVANGTNIGRKAAEWLAILGPIHPYCRCALHYLPKGYVWNEKTKKFEVPPKEAPFRPQRKPIRVWINGKEQYV